jgi:hypothetical protein
MNVATTPMDPFFRYYIGFWMTGCALAVLLFLRDPRHYQIGRRVYWLFITEPWKLLTFVVACALLTFGAPCMGDPTWDWFDGLFMSIFCYTTAPWVVAVLYFAARQQAGPREVFVAICAWLFSASWSYDIYLVWRDGLYPDTWFANLFASSVIYLCAGLFWNLEWAQGRGVIFSFMRADWPGRAARYSLWRLSVYAVVFALPLLGAFWMFLH